MKVNEQIITRKVLVEKHTITRRLVQRDVALHELISESYRYKSTKGEISLLYPCYATMNMYEIYCPELFEDIERYDTSEEVEERIRELLL
jgi:hypothetical protein